MAESAKEVQTLEDVRRYVAETLCGLELLKSDQFELSQRELYRSGKPCGMHFCLHGPRELRLYAIWETDQNSILFYGSSGRRMQRTKLMQVPTVDDATRRNLDKRT